MISDEIFRGRLFMANFFLYVIAPSAAPVEFRSVASSTDSVSLAWVVCINFTLDKYLFIPVIFGTKYSRMDQVKFVGDSLQKTCRPYHFKFLKAVFHKFYLVHS